jgi:hypothetical protein
MRSRGAQHITSVSDRREGRGLSRDSRRLGAKQVGVRSSSTQGAQNQRRTRVVGAFSDGQSPLNLAAARLRHRGRPKILNMSCRNVSARLRAADNHAEVGHGGRGQEACSVSLSIVQFAARSNSPMTFLGD